MAKRTLKWGLALISMLLSTAIVVLVLLCNLWWTLPDVSTLVNTPMQTPLRIYSADHTLMAEYGEKQRIPVPLSAVPQLFIDALLATEDQRFYDHNGIDMMGIGRALHQLVVTGQKRQGASTITMQVARNFYLSREKTYARKLKEMLLALKIDHALSKNQILTLYVNKIYLGQRAYGVAAAARNYYGKTLQQLTLPEMAMLAGLPKAPSRNNPIRNPKAAKARRNFVLKRMHTMGYIDRADHQAAIAAPLTASRHEFHVELNAPYVAEYVRRQLYKRYGDAVYTRGLKVITTIQPRVQQAAQQSLRQGILKYDQTHGYRAPSRNLNTLGKMADWPALLKTLPHTQRAEPAVVVMHQGQQLSVLRANHHVVQVTPQAQSWQPRKASAKTQTQFLAQFKLGDVVYIHADFDDGHWALTQVPAVQGAVVVMAPDTGAVLGLVGGYHHGLSHFNRATQSKRQPGSSIKPFIYASALEHGMTLASRINDAPVVAYDSQTHKLWRPQNHSHTFQGMTTLRHALMHSSNLVTIRLVKWLGIPEVQQALQHFGFDGKHLPDGLSLALGTGEVTPWQLTGSFATFANGGYAIHPHVIARILDRHQHVLYDAHETRPPPYRHIKLNKVRILKADTAFLINDALRTVIQHGTGRYAKRLKRQYMAGKTGTTNQLKDAWFVGYTRHFLATVWMGYDDNTSLKAYAAQTALPVWTHLMQMILKNHPDQPFDKPANILSVRINNQNGLRTALSTQDSRFEYFRKRHMPAQEVAKTPTHTKPQPWLRVLEPMPEDNEALF